MFFAEQPTVDRVPPTVALSIASPRRTTLRHSGVVATVTLNEPGSVTVVVQDADRHQVSAATTGLASLPSGGATTVAVRLTQSAKTALRRGKKIRWSVLATATDGVGNIGTKRKRLWIG
ncbi:MAG: hypothetical protein QM679_07585 [Patulibacter sp.]